LAASVIDHLRALILGQIENILTDEASFKKMMGLISPLMPADKPMNGLPGIFIEQEIEIEKKPFLMGEQVADIPTPSLIRPSELSANWRD
jgi:hypothetical protein